MMEVKATIIALGMHRSFTSLTAKGLTLAGVHMGRRLLGPGRGNEHGHFEDVEFIRLNDRILRLAGGAWNDPPTYERIIGAGQILATDIEQLVRRAEVPPLWGWKDPRTTLTVECYLPHVKNPVLVPNFRSPADVAQSLLRRDGMPVDLGTRLAAEYNRRLLRTCGKFAGLIK